MNNPNQFLQINQVGIVVHDLRKTIAGMRMLFGVVPDTLAQTRKNHRLYHGKDGNFIAEIALYNFANIQFEFIQPLEGENIWRDHLTEHGEGLQHVCFLIDDFQKAHAQMEQAGIMPSQQGIAVNRPLRWDYFNTEEIIGFTVETCSPIDSDPDNFRR